MSELNNIALKIINKGKGILAADESTGTMTKRLSSVKVDSTPQNRLLFRETLFTSSCMTDCIGGVILYDETIKQSSSKKKKITELISEMGSLPGIKVDTGAKILANHDTEKITEGLDGLRDRLKTYKEKGADFAKWRAVITIGENTPSTACIQSNAHSLARYASLCQENELVPIVEPEVLMDGSHSIQTCYDVTNRTLETVFKELELLKVDLESIVLKPNMILPAINSNQNISNEEIATMTFNVLQRNVPKLVPGIAFLSGGQSSDLAAIRLNLINKKYNSEKNWNLTFSYGRALQEDALTTWSLYKKGEASISSPQDALIKRAQMNSEASTGNLIWK